MAGEERVIIDVDLEYESPTNAFISRNRCCFHFPCFGPGPKAHTLAGPSPSPSSSNSPAAGSSFWDRIRVGENNNKWWARPIRAFKKIREWSEIVAGPKWKTFIRRFNRNNRHRHGHVSTGKFQYDPLSYALNFDEGPGQNGQFVDEDFVEHYPDFSSRFAVLPMSAKSSMDLGRGAPAS